MDLYFRRAKTLVLIAPLVAASAWVFPLEVRTFFTTADGLDFGLFTVDRLMPIINRPASRVEARVKLR